MNNKLKMKLEELIELRVEFGKLASGESTSANYKMLTILGDCLINILNEHGTEAAKSQSEVESKLILHMMFSKLLSLRKMIDGIEFNSKSGIKLNNLIDPTVVAALVRTIYETVAMFNLVYIIPQTEEEKSILYNLWVIAGLKYRQRFAEIATTTENKQKQVDEAQKIVTLATEIEHTALYTSLDEKNRNIIKQALKKKDYKIRINNNSVTALSWEAVVTEMGMKVGIMGNLYTYFSLYGHPSNVAVFQFKDLFDKSKNDYTGISNTLFLLAIKQVSFFIANYIDLFPNTKRIFESLPLLDQCLINYHSKFLREDGRTINDALNSLG